MKKKSAVNTLNCLSAGSKKILSHFCNNLKRDCENDIFDDHMFDLLDVVLKDKEILHRVRSHCNLYNYSQSRKEYSQLVTQLDSFCSPNHPSFRWNRNYQQSKSILKSIFENAKLKSLIYQNDTDIEDALPKKSTHSGWSFVETGLRQKGEYLDGVFGTWVQEVQKAKENSSFNKIILPGIRTQCSNIYNEDGTLTTKNAKHKTRLVSMIDVYVIISELVIAKPIQSWMSNNCRWYAGGKNDNQLHNIVVVEKQNHRNWLSLDYSKYDQSISDWLIYDAFEIIESAFTTIDDKELLEVVKNDFVNKVFIDGDQQLHHSTKGVPSGSMFTQIIDSIVNYLIIQTYMLSINSKFECIIMGDDNLIFSHDDLDKTRLCSYLSKNFGITANDQKTTFGTYKQDPQFLSRTWTMLGPWRTPEILICKLLFPEKFRDYTEIDVKLILYSYILAYRKGIDEIMMVHDFIRDLHVRESQVLRVGGKYLPGYLGFRNEYLLSK